MSESIFLLQSSGQLIEMTESGYLTEDQLQNLLAQHPGLIAGGQIDPENPRRWLLVSREFGVPDEENNGNRWSLDHLFLDQDAVPTLVEVKRSTDTRIRREVIGQIMDYAANAVFYWSIEEIRHQLDERCRREGERGSETLRTFLAGECEEEVYWERLRTNLKAGKVRMLIVADTISRELQRIIEFLNSQMNPAVILGVEIKQFVNSGVKTLVPKVVGLTAASDQVKGKGGRKEGSWDEASFIAELVKRNGIESGGLVRKLMVWAASKNVSLAYGRGASTASLQFWFNDRSMNLVPCFIVYSYGSVELQFQHMKHAPFDQMETRSMLLDKINQLSGVSIAYDKLTKRPPVPLLRLREEENMRRFIDAFDWYLEETAKHLS